MQRQLCKFCSDSCTFELENKVCLEICYFWVWQHWSAHTKSTGWQTNPDTNNSKNTWHWLTGKWFKERGDELLLWKSGKSEKTRKSCFVWHLQLSKINFSGVTQGPGKCDKKFYAIPRCVSVSQWEIFQVILTNERLVWCYHCQKSGWWHSFKFRRIETNIITENVCMTSFQPQPSHEEVIDI